MYATRTPGGVRISVSWPIFRGYGLGMLGRVSILHRGDEELHYSDSSHRWIAPPDVDQTVWEAGMRAHLDRHRSTMGGPLDLADPREPRRAPRIPKPRRPTEPVSHRTAHRGTGIKPAITSDKAVGSTEPAAARRS